MTLRLSAVGLETTHGFIYPAMLSGYAPAPFRSNSVEHVWSIFPTEGAASVESALEDALTGVDGVLFLGGDARAHRRLATGALEAGLATFVDKPFTETLADAEALAELADKRGAPLFCTSALRFAPQTVALRARLGASVGRPRVDRDFDGGGSELSGRRSARRAGPSAAHALT